MFGLSEREQRWKAEEKAAEIMVAFAERVLSLAVDARIAEAHLATAELARLKTEVAELRSMLEK